MALRRFISRRGMPSIILSDNAIGFWAAKQRLLAIYSSEGPDWRFIALPCSVVGRKVGTTHRFSQVSPEDISR